MTLSSKKVGAIIGLVVVALGGLVALQASLLNYAWTLKEQAFRRNVMSAMGQISHGLATGEAIMVVFAADTANRLQIEARMETVTSENDVELRRFERKVMIVDSLGGHTAPIWTEGDTIHYSVKSPQHVALKVLDPMAGCDTVYVDSFHEPGDYRVSIAKEHSTGGSFFWHYSTDSAAVMMEMTDGVQGPVQPMFGYNTGKQRLVTSVFRDLVNTEFTPIEDRLDSINVDSVVAATLADNGVDLEYAYGVISEQDDSLHVAVPEVYGSDIRESDYKVRLFPQDVFAPPTNLALYFPTRGSYLWRQMGPLLAVTVGLMLIVIACFAYTIRTILRQRRFSGLMVDFINNMTHEFKTPIATVALASEAIQRPDIVNEPEQVRRFTDMIQSENRRMRNQADKILQMAVLEKEEYELSYSDVDLHEVIGSAVDAIALHVEHRRGTVVCHLQAAEHVLRADKVHVTNVIHNLLDNANKYSPEGPEITVRTFDSDGGVGLRIEDRGIGLRAEDRRRVFEKYFRVPTGNRHDVKGFGLGLSYVKLMVEAHGGTITLNSRLGEGTEVEVILPIRAVGETS